MQIFGWNSNSSGIPFFVSRDNDRSQGIINHDSYEVYVNGDYVGNKDLITQGEEISDIDKHLQQEGFKAFNEDVMGNHVDISTNDLEEARKIKRNLEVYLKIR